MTGGLVGNFSNSIISQSWTSGKIMVANDISSKNYVGGLIGKTYENSMIINCCTTSNVSAMIDIVNGSINLQYTYAYAGGLVGYNYGGIKTVMQLEM